MKLYTFYPTNADGLAPTFLACELADESAAEAEAQRLLDEHERCASVVVYEGGRPVIVRRRCEDQNVIGFKWKPAETPDAV